MLAHTTSIPPAIEHDSGGGLSTLALTQVLELPVSMIRLSKERVHYENNGVM